MKYPLSAMGTVPLLIFLILFRGDGVFAARTLPKDIAPDVPAETSTLLDAHSAVYLEGTGKRDVLLIADTFCENSRKTYGLLKENMKYIRRLKVVLVSRYPMLGSDLVAAHVMRMHAQGKGGSALEQAFAFETLRIEGFKARRQAMNLAVQTFQLQYGRDETPDTLPELQLVTGNTKLAQDAGYSGTPHLIVGGRVLHGYSRAAIKILLGEDP